MVALPIVICLIMNARNAFHLIPIIHWNIFIFCVDVVESRQTYYNVNNLSDFAYECRIWKFVEEIDLNATI